MLKLFRSQLGKAPLTRRALAQSYRTYQSLSEQFPWTEYDACHQCFPLNDGKSVAAIFELEDVATEAKPEAYLLQLQQGLQSVLQDAFPHYFDQESPWIVQFYLQDELSLNHFYQHYAHAIPQPIKQSLFTTHYLDTFKTHLEWMARPQGIFTDTKVSSAIFRGKIRKIRMVIYRCLTRRSRLSSGNAREDLQALSSALMAKLQSCGIKVTLADAKAFYEWMLAWFNPAPLQGDGSAFTLMERCPYPGDEAMPWGYDFSEQLFYSLPQSDQQKGVWYFDEKPHRYLRILGLNALPKRGHLTLERPFGNYAYALFDQFPQGSIFQMTVVMQSQEVVKNHLQRIEHSARRVSSSMEAEMAKEDCQLARRAIESGNYFYPTIMGVYVRGDDLADLDKKSIKLETLLSSHGLHTLHGHRELTPLDHYLRHLPMCYSYEFDQARTFSHRYVSGKQLSQLLPFYGRERGSGNPGLTFFNRCGEPFTFDPFNPKDKDFNSHLLMLGTTGGGKSATCVYLLMQVMALYRPRLVIVDVGNSFKLLGEYFKHLGFTVNRVEIAFQSTSSLNPFAESANMLKQLKQKQQAHIDELIKKQEEELNLELAALHQEASPIEQEAKLEHRDYLGEMLLAAQLMITGGEPKEEAALSREDRYWIMKAIVFAAKTAEEKGKEQMIASDLVLAFTDLAKELEANTKDQDMMKRLNKMAANLNLFCEDSLSSRYFNVRGNPWPDVDVTILEMGLFKDEGYEAERALAYLGALNKTMALAEHHQYSERFTLFLCDEVHHFTKYPPTMLATTKVSKTSRKYALWLWLATQNIADFKDEARKMLSMMEFWMCLGMSEAELTEIERFKSLTDEERSLFRSVRKEAGKYVEGVLLCPRIKGLFRNIPPRLSLALAMTEKTEKAQRQSIMQEKGCTEVEAAMVMAEKMLGR